MVLFKLAVWKEVGNDRLLAALQFVELAPKKDYIPYHKCDKSFYGALCGKYLFYTTLIIKISVTELS